MFCHFAFLGELVHGQITNVFLLETIFEPTSVWAYNQEYILAHLENLSAEEPFFPPLGANNEHAEEIETRPLMYLPAIYVPLLLSSGGYNPRQVLERLYSAIQQCQEVAICHPLLRWLQAATMATAVINQGDQGDPSIAIPLGAPPANKVLLNNRSKILHQIIPGLADPPPCVRNSTYADGHSLDIADQ